MKCGKKTAGYRVIAGNGGNRYKFYCDRSGALGCTTDVIRVAAPEEELRIAWEEAPCYCSKCGTRARDDDVLCRACGTRIQYGGEEL